jgi:hypothetical protein
MVPSSNANARRKNRARSSCEITSLRGQFAGLAVAKSRLCCDAWARLTIAILRGFPISNECLN